MEEGLTEEEEDGGWSDHSLVPGKSYHVFFEDCCVKGDFVGKFIRIDMDKDRAVFDVGEIGEPWGPIRFEEIA